MTGNAPTSRRRFMKAAAGATVGAGVTAAGAHAPPAMRPVGEAKAVLPAVAIGVGGMAAFEGAQLVRDYVADEPDEPPDGLSGGALEDRVYSATRSRQSENASTFVDTGNILQGAKHVAWADGKLAAIEALNDQEAKADVTSTGQTAVDDYEATLKRNFYRTWNAAANELENLAVALSDHPDTNIGDPITARASAEGNSYPDTSQNGQLTTSFQTTTVTLPDGEDQDVVEIVATDNADVIWSPVTFSGDAGFVNYSGDTVEDAWLEVHHPDGSFDYMIHSEWGSIVEDIESICSNVRDGITTWVDGVYDQVQSGEIDTADLLTPREIAELTAEEEEEFNQAMADLMALNVPVNLDREAEIHIPATGATLYGHLGVTGGGEVSTGTYDPDTEEEDYYLTYDAAKAEGEWGAYDLGIDGGIVTFTEEPYEGVEYEIFTIDDEMATAVYDDFVQDGSDWTVDVSDQLENAIVDIEKVDYFATSENVDNYTVRLTDQFEIVTYRDTETGEEHDSATHEEPQTPQDDDNYITQEEWEEERDRLQDQIDAWKEIAQSGGGGGLIGDDSSMLIVGGGLLAGGYALLSGGGSDS